MHVETDLSFIYMLGSTENLVIEKIWNTFFEKEICNKFFCKSRLNIVNNEFPKTLLIFLNIY